MRNLFFFSYQTIEITEQIENYSKQTNLIVKISKKLKYIIKTQLKKKGSKSIHRYSLPHKNTKKKKN